MFGEDRSRHTVWCETSQWVPLKYHKYLLNGLRTNIPPQRIWNSHIILHSSLVYQWSVRLKLGFPLNCAGVQNCRWRHVHHHLVACELKISKLSLVSWKFPNSGTSELKFGQKLRLAQVVEAKISKFSQKGVLWTDSFAWNGTLANYRRGVKRGSSGSHIPIAPF